MFIAIINWGSNYIIWVDFVVIVSDVHDKAYIVPSKVVTLYASNVTKEVICEV